MTNTTQHQANCCANLDGDMRGPCDCGAAHPSVADDAKLRGLLFSMLDTYASKELTGFSDSKRSVFAHIDTLLAAAREAGRNEAYEEYSPNENAAWNAYNTSGCWGHEPTVKAIFTDGYRAAQPPAAIVALKNLVDELIASDEEGLISHVESMQKAMSLLKNGGAQIKKAIALDAAIACAEKAEAALAAESKRVRALEILVDAYGKKSYQYDIEHPCDGLNALAAAQPPVLAEARQQIPDGWRLVPTEPTPKMVEAAANADDEGFEAGRSHGASGREIYAAMLAAAPAAPQQEVKGD